MKPVVQQMLPNAATLLKTSVALSGGVGVDPGTAERVDPQAGGRVGSTLLTQNTAWLIKKTTAVGGRRNQGRWFVPGVPDVSVNDVGAVNAAEVTNWNTALETYVNALSAGGVVDDLVILHGQGTGGGGPLAPTVIIEMRCDLRVATQRRRLRR
jgi:hypothetical protein